MSWHVCPIYLRTSEETDTLTSSFIVVDVDPLQLQVAVPMVAASGINAMLITDDLPELEEIIGKQQLLTTAVQCQSQTPVQSLHAMSLTTPLHGRAAAREEGESVQRGFPGHSS